MGKKELDRIYSRAREAGADAEEMARITAKGLSRDQLVAEYVSLCGLVAYYGKLERDQIGNPIRHFADIRRRFDNGDIDLMLSSIDDAEVERLYIRNREPILDILAQVRMMLGEFTDPPEQDRGTQPSQPLPPPAS